MSPIAVEDKVEPYAGGKVEKNPLTVDHQELSASPPEENHLFDRTHSEIPSPPPPCPVHNHISLAKLEAILSDFFPRRNGSRSQLLHDLRNLHAESPRPKTPSPKSTVHKLPPGLQMTAMGMGQDHGSPQARRSAASTAPGSPRIVPVRQNSGTVTPRVRGPATTLSIPGLTSSKVSPDGKIPDRDVASKCIVLMVGLPARGKSYITKKIHRYLRWQQHNTRIFNVGNRRRLANAEPAQTTPTNATKDTLNQAAKILLNGIEPEQGKVVEDHTGAEHIEQSADFFDPLNKQASQIRDQLAMGTLDEALHFLLKEGGSVAILDATNSTIERRRALYDHIKAREPNLQILFIESICQDPQLLEANIQLKLGGPDYKDKDPKESYIDFKKRMEAYDSAYVPLGKYEEENKMQYIQMTDVGRKFVQFNISGFLAMGMARYLANFNLAPRQIWITRHGQSTDNLENRIGGNSHLTLEGTYFATALYNLVTRKRHDWDADQRARVLSDFHKSAGDSTAPPPDLFAELDAKNFCVWTSMLHRSVETAEAFLDDDEYDVKNWENLKELDAGEFEGLTYEQIRENHPEEFAKRKADKFTYNYPGVGGEGYLRVIGRLRELITEIERIKDHVLIIGHRSVCRVLMAYFMDLDHMSIANLDIPLGMAISIEPKPYGMEAHAYRFNPSIGDFDEIEDYDPRKQVSEEGPECKPSQTDSPTESPINDDAATDEIVQGLLKDALNGTIDLSRLHRCICNH